MDMIKEIGVGIGTWIGTSVIVWAVARSAAVREWFGKRPWAIALSLSLVTVVLAFGYTQYAVGALRAQLSVWPKGQQPQANELCPAGQYVVGLNHEDEPGLAHGAIFAVQIMCQPLNVQ